PLALKVTFGKSLMTSSKVVIDIWASESPVSAWIVIGTSWIDCARRCAVTTTSSRPPEGAACASQVPACALSAATIAEAIFWLVFKNVSPVVSVCGGKATVEGPRNLRTDNPYRSLNSGEIFD